MTAASRVELEPVTQRRGSDRRRRVGNVDILRAVAALAVLAIHAYALGGRPAPIKAQNWYDVPLITLATGVWLFFAISGYVISRPFVDALLGEQPLPALRRYAIRRGFRIFPLYWVALTAVVAIDGAQGTRAWQFPFHYLLLNNLIPGRQEALFPSAWTLTLELLFYCLVPVLAVAIRSRRPTVSPERLAGCVAASWAASIAFTVVADVVAKGQTGLWLRGSLAAMWQMFCPGILLAIAPHLRGPGWRRWIVLWPRRRVTTAIAVVLLIVAAVLGAASPLRFGVVPFLVLTDASRPLFALGYGLLLAAAIRGRPWGDRAPWALELGLVSYGIYLLHPIVIDLLLQQGASPVHRDTLAAFAVNGAAVAALTVPLALVSWRWFEHPLINYSRRLGRGDAALRWPRWTRRT